MGCFKHIGQCLTYKRLKIILSILSVLLFLIEICILTSSIIILSSSDSSSIFIYTLILSLFSTILSIQVFLLPFLINSSFKPWKKILIIFDFLLFISLSSLQLYLSILILSYSSELQSELSKCESSEIFSEVIWTYKKIYSICEDFSNCQCLEDSDCAGTLVPLLYDKFECSGICEVGDKKCDQHLTEVFDKSKVLFGMMQILAFIVFIAITGTLIALVRKRVREEWDRDRMQQSYRVQEKTIANLEGISVRLESCIEKSQFPNDISSIPRQSFISLDDSQHIS